MKKNISIYQMISIFVFLIFLLFQITACSVPYLNIFSNLKFISFVGIGLIIFIVYSWKKTYYRLLSPYLVFVILLFLCLCGQIPFWAFGQSAGFRDLTVWMNLFTKNDLCQGLLFSYLCISFLHLVVILSIDPKTKKTKCKNNDSKTIVKVIENKEAYQKITIFGIILCIIFIIPYLSNFYYMRNIIETHGYDMQYDAVTTGIASIFTKLADFFPLGIITIVFVWGRKNQFNKKNYYLKKISLTLFSLLYLICELLLGQRTGLILFILALLFVKYKDKKIPIKNIIVLGIFGLVLMAGMRVVGVVRSGNEFNIENQNNPIVDFISDTGWNLMTTIEFQKIIPTVKGYGYGTSYIVSILSIIPNLNFWPVHPAYVYGNISPIIRDYLGYSYGLGCTPVAEAYYNFGYFGFLVFLIWGMFLKNLNRKFERKDDFISNYQVILFIGILLKSCVRSSFFAVFRPLLLFVILPSILIKLISNKTILNKGGDNT